jgi:beta-glucosidase
MKFMVLVKHLRTALFTVYCSLITVYSFSQQPLYLDPKQPIDQRVEDLLSRMTLEEKVGQINMPCVYQGRYGRDIPAKTEGVKKFLEGTLVPIGPGGGYFTLANEILRDGTRQQAEFFNQLQKLAKEKTRLQVPLMQCEEGTHGFMAPGATIFPEGQGLGAMWNPDLIREIYATAAEEARSVGVHQLYTLVIEPNRDPRHGRNEQTFSEDPYLCSIYAENIVKGAQGGDISANNHVISGLCHFPGQTQGLNGINRGAMDISERTFREIFLPPWIAGIKKAGALGVMATHPTINGYPNHGSEKNLTKILREELGFQGNVLSEGSNTGCLIYERVVATEKEAGPIVLKAGVDVNITFESGYMKDMIDNIKEGKVSMELLDRAVRRVLRLKFMLGLFENPYVDVERAVKIVHSQKNQDLALKASQEGIVLLKNEPVNSSNQHISTSAHQPLLPLPKNLKSIAVIGPNADNDVNLLGDYIPKKLINKTETVLDAIKKKVSPATKITYVKGCEVLNTKVNNIAEAVKVAHQSQIAIVVVGEDARTDGESKDCVDLELTGLQNDLVKAIYETGTPTVVVLMSGRPLAIRYMAENIPSIIESWMPGEKGGQAITDVLFGDINPSGKLPITFPRHVGQMPFYYNYKPSKYMRREIAYVTMPLSPLYPFGHGLSYTTFEYSNLNITPKESGPAANYIVTCDVKNNGQREGKEVVQLYIDDEISSMVTPIIELKGFEKISLKAGEKKTVTFTLTPESLQMLDANMQWVVEPGAFKVMVGSSCEDIRLEGEFNVK